MEYLNADDRSCVNWVSKPLSAHLARMLAWLAFCWVIPMAGAVNLGLYTVEDGNGGLGTGWGMVTVAPVNGPPVGQPDEFTLGKNEVLTISAPGVLVNDFDVDGDSLSALPASLPLHGSLTLNPDGSFTYQPVTNYYGSDTFTYVAADASSFSISTLVTLFITNINRAPVALPDTLNAVQNSPLNAPGTVLTANDYDLDGDAFAIVPVELLSSQAGSVSITTNSVLYTPALDFVGTDTFAYVIEDEFGARATGVVSVVVSAPEFAFSAGTNVFNPQTGLFEQRVAVTNTGLAAAAAVRVLVSELRSGVRLWNATGTNDGVPYVQYNAPLNPGSNIVLRLEYYVTDRRPFTSTLEVVAVQPDQAGTSSAVGVPVTTAFVDSRIPGEPRFVIEFPSLVGGSYTIFYSDNLTIWRAAKPSIMATSPRTQWYDDGPPKTATKPLTGGSRYYRVVVNPHHP